MPSTRTEDSVEQNRINQTGGAPTPGGGGSAKGEGAIWGDAELADPHGRQDKPERVRGMFGAIAHSYDLNNRLHSLGVDQSWRRRAVKMASVKPGDEVLDVACGTGDLTHLFARSGAARVVGADFTPQMLEIAREKLSKRSDLRNVTYVEADAMALPFADRSFDVVSIAFGIRNVAKPAVAIGEFARVLRPGGRLVVLEFDRPRNPVVRAVNNLYTQRIMPLTATLVSRDRSGAYRYLPRSVGTFMSREEMCDVIARSGFSDVTVRSLTFGIAACYRGIRPS